MKRKKLRFSKETVRLLSVKNARRVAGGYETVSCNLCGPLHDDSASLCTQDDTNGTGCR